MKKLFLILFAFILSFSCLLAPVPQVRAEATQEELEKQIQEYQAKLAELSGQKQTLAQALAVLNTQIKLTETKIAATAAQLDKLGVEIDDLSGRIDSIDYSLTDLTKLFISRVRETYMRRSTYETEIVAQSSGLSDILRNIEYAKKVRDHDRSVLISLEKSRLDYDTQKQIKEAKQDEIEALKKKLDADKAALATQVASKNKLLAETKNSEAQYQKLLAQAQAELIAIKGIIAGLGKEVKVKNVQEGDRVASIIQGASPCSTGTHLHFEVTQNGSRRNPFEMLKSTSLIWDNSDPAQNGTGSWNWPLNDPIRITQGYGHTAYSSRYTGDIHTGVDMSTENSTVKAVKAGELYQGSVKCGSGNLLYVRVKHADNFDTYYLHVNY
jgi:peptidoglycan hydrolase CwlO-like protein